jgi:hypothetical protein
MSPDIIFDKSAFESISQAEHSARLLMFEENITPVLLREVVGDLSKAEAGNIPVERLVPALAAKFCGGGGAVNYDWKFLCMESLIGARIPMGGWIIPQGMEQVTMPNGEAALYLDSSTNNHAIIRWANAEFTNRERAWADKFRAESSAFEEDILRGRLRGSPLERATSIERIAATVDDFLDDPTHYPLVLDWLVDQMRPLRPMMNSLPAARTATIRRWERQGRPHLREFAPYAHHCARTLLFLLVGSDVLSKRPTNRVDLEYLLYLPFCHVFVSQDRLHHQLAPLVLRDYQVYLRAPELKADLQRVIADRTAVPPSQRSRLQFAFGTGPWPAPRSVLWALSERFSPWTPRHVNRAHTLPPEQATTAIEEARILVNEANADPAPLLLGTAGGPIDEKQVTIRGSVGLWRSAAPVNWRVEHLFQ